MGGNFKVCPDSTGDQRSLDWLTWQLKTEQNFFRKGLSWCLWMYCFSVQFSHSVVSDSLRLHESQHTKPPCPSPTPRVYPNSCPSSRWCHPSISSYVVPFSSCPQSLPASESFPMSQLFTWGGEYWSFNFRTSLSNEHPGLISFRNYM